MWLCGLCSLLAGKVAPGSHTSRGFAGGELRATTSIVHPGLSSLFQRVTIQKNLGETLLIAKLCLFSPVCVGVIGEKTRVKADVMWGGQ